MARKLPVRGQVTLHLIFIIVTICYLIPMLLVVSISLTNEDDITSLGVSLIPPKLSTKAYELAFNKPDQILNAYAVTASTSILGMVLSVFFMTLYAYPLSRHSYKGRKFFTFVAFFTMLFSGGLVPSYYINTRFLGLMNSYWIYIWPGLMGAWNIIIIRTFFQGLPEALPEAAKIDGASELRTYFQIILPLSVPVMAAVGFLVLIAKWNDWMTSLIYISPTNSHMYTLQYLLQRILREAEMLKELVKAGDALLVDESTPPAESLKYAMAVIAAGPMLVVFPLFQKYFTTGLTVGAVKG